MARYKHNKFQIKRSSHQPATGHNRNTRNQTIATLFNKSLLAAAIGTLLSQNCAQANPVGGKVVAGSAHIVNKAPGKLEIIQKSNKAIIDWRGFSIARGEHTRFRQPSSSSIALNRVRGGQASLIDGILTANGNVWLINPNGVLFGKGAQVNVRGLIATTSDINNEDFMAGRYSFNKPTDNIDAAIVNQGRIEVTDGGSVVLAGHRVSNKGSIKARLGHVVLASGDTFTMDFDGDGLLQFDIGDPVQQSTSKDQTEALVANSGQITVDGGIVEMTAKTRNTMVERVINMEGVVQARAVDVEGGTIILSGGEKGIVAVSGTLDVSGKEQGQVGGVAKILGEKVGLFDGAEIDASGDAGGGEVLVGGNLHGAGLEQNARETIVADDVAIHADALNQGEGGIVAVWADESADINGTLTARGGSVSGNGGFIETSGKQFLKVSTSPDASASNGEAGTWLIDPTDISIVASEEDTEINTSIVAAQTINKTLNSGTNVTLDTSTATDTSSEEFQIGTISLASGANISNTGDGNPTLTLQAENNIIINGNIGSPITNGIIGPPEKKLNVVLNSDRDGNGAGAIVINPGANISSNGGDIVMGGGSNPLEDFAFGTTFNPDGGIKIEGDELTFVEINAEGGDIIINGKGVAPNDNNQFGGSGVSVDKSVLKTSDGGRIRIQGDGGNGIFLDAIVIESSEIVTEDGNIDLLGVGNSDISSNSIFIADSKVESSRSGSITISSTDSDGELENISIFSGDIGTNSGNINITSTKVELDNDTNVRSKEGDIRLDGSGEGIDVTDTILETSGNGNITLRGVSENADQAGVNLSSFEGEGFSPGPIITTGTGNGTILIQADRLTMG